LCALLAAATAQAEALLVDTAQSQASFALRALWVKKIDGEFARVEGVITREPAAGSFGVDVRIDAHSVRMPREDHAVWARSGDFFDAARHPWIRFRAEAQPDRHLREGGPLRGELTLRGVTRAVEFVLAPSDCPRPGIDCAVRARGEVQRSDFGMDARRFVLGDRVRLDFAIRVHPAGAPDAG
jgi:polyisoprenoid-binding protein YceI